MTVRKTKCQHEIAAQYQVKNDLQQAMLLLNAYTAYISQAKSVCTLWSIKMAVDFCLK